MSDAEHISYHFMKDLLHHAVHVHLFCPYWCISHDLLLCSTELLFCLRQIYSLLVTIQFVIQASSRSRNLFDRPLFRITLDMLAGMWSDDEVAMPHTQVAATGPTPKTAKQTKKAKTTKDTKKTKKTKTALTPSYVAKVAKKPSAATKLALNKSALTKHYIKHGSVYKLKPGHYMADKHTARPLLDTTLGRPLALATDFGGIETPSQALENMGIKHDLKFYTECQGHLREFVGSAFRPDLIYCDVLDRRTETMPSCDLFVLGPPASHGQRRGSAWASRT